jgi:hypothetical protein
LDGGEARSVRWSSGFYEVQQTRKDIFDMLGEPNVPPEP